MFTGYPEYFSHQHLKPRDRLYCNLQSRSERVAHRYLSPDPPIVQ